MSDAQPWEDQSLKGAYWKEKERRDKVLGEIKKMKPVPAAAKPTPTATDAWDQAKRFKRRNEVVAEATKGLRD